MGKYYKKKKRFIKDEWLDEIVIVFEKKSITPGMTYNDCADELNNKFRVTFSESAWRKRYQTYLKDYELFVKKFMNNEFETKEIDNRLKNLIQADMRIALKRKEVNIMAREFHTEMNKQAKFKIIENYMLALDGYQYKEIRQENYKTKKKETERAVMYAISDIHYGLYSEKVKDNVYTPEVAIKRVYQIADFIVEDVKKNKYEEFIISDFGDLIEGAGNLRNSQLLSTMMTLTEQSMGVIDLLTNFFKYINDELKDLSFKPKATVYLNSASNHSEIRVANTSRGEISNDNMAILICNNVLSNIRGFGSSIYRVKKHNENGEKEYEYNVYYADSYILDIIGNIVYLAHGDEYKHGTDIHSFLAKNKNQIVDYVFTGHWHSDSKVTYGTRGKRLKAKYTLPSICGDSEYSTKNGWSSPPAAKKYIFDKYRGVILDETIVLD